MLIMLTVCVSNVLHCDCGIWGEGKKFYVLTKHVKKNTFLFSLGIFQSLIKSMGGKWVGFCCDFSVDSFYCDIVMLCIELTKIFEGLVFVGL